ncbi:electron transfer flavoprotein subunit beta/FixA family protein [Clostridiaceae bacterium M8S5]|nr:electron transfer flavoprotein subunit beta/FixA family protein [Clostridiaceae bacterium M8S5]
MQIVVCIKQVPGTSEVEVDEITGVLKREGIDSKMNPYDLYALETAIRIKESSNACINVVTMGPPQAKQVIRESYMMGADKGVLLTDRRFAGADVLATAYTISQGIRKINDNNIDLIICGKQTTDGDTAQVGPEIAEFLDIPHITNVTKLVEVKEDSIIVEVDNSDSIEVSEIEFPCLITVEKDIFTPRLPSFKRKLVTKDTEITQYTLDDFDDKEEEHYGINGSPTQVKRIFPPESNTSHEAWNGTSDELANKIYYKLKELKFI